MSLKPRKEKQLSKQQILKNELNGIIATKPPYDKMLFRDEFKIGIVNSATGEIIFTISEAINRMSENELEKALEWARNRYHEDTLKAAVIGIKKEIGL